MLVVVYFDDLLCDCELAGFNERTTMSSAALDTFHFVTLQPDNRRNKVVHFLVASFFSVISNIPLERY